MRYNESVKQLNLFTRKVFGGFFASRRGIEKRKYFEITDDTIRNIPKVAF